MAISPPDLWKLVLPRLQSQVERGLTVELVAEFTGAAPQTAKDWIKSIRPATGDRLIKLWYLTAILDDALEIKQQQPFTDYVSRLFAYGTLSIQDVCMVFNVANTQGAFRLMRVSKPTHPAFTLSELKLEHDSVLHPLMESWKQRVTAAIQPPKPASEAVVPKLAPRAAPRLPDVPVSNMSVQTELVLELARSLSAVAPLARYVLELCSAEDRSLLRRLMTNESLFDLSNALNALCGERSRSQGR